MLWMMVQRRRWLPDSRENRIILLLWGQEGITVVFFVGLWCCFCGLYIKCLKVC